MPATLEKKHVSEHPAPAREVPDRRVTPTSVAFTPDDIRWLDTVADDEQISRSAVVRQALRAFKKARSHAQG